jgi:hypothetical protein
MNRILSAAQRGCLARRWQEKSDETCTHYHYS